jgi:hypothetical protein
MGAQVMLKKGTAHKNHLNHREHKVAKFAQIICKEVKRAFNKQSNKRKKRQANGSENESNSDYSP